MAIGDAYVDLAELKFYMGFEDTEPERDALLTAAASVASEQIELFCNRQFNKVSSATARVYFADDATHVFTDDMSAAPSLVEVMETDDVWTTVTDYVLRPLNGIRNGKPGWPYWHLTSKRDNAWPVDDEPTVRVTAVWGWASVPYAVKQATLQIAAETFQLKDTRMGLAGADQFGTIVRVRDNQLVRGWLSQYQRDKTRVA